MLAAGPADGNNGREASKRNPEPKCIGGLQRFKVLEPCQRVETVPFQRNLLFPTRRTGDNVERSGAERATAKNIHRQLLREADRRKFMGFEAAAPQSASAIWA